MPHSISIDNVYYATLVFACSICNFSLYANAIFHYSDITPAPPRKDKNNAICQMYKLALFQGYLFLAPTYLYILIRLGHCKGSLKDKNETFKCIPDTKHQSFYLKV